MKDDILPAFLQLIASNKEAAAYKLLHEQYYTRLQSFAFPFVKSNEVAEEIVADVLFKIWEQRSNVSHIQHLKVYLFTAVRNHCLNYLRREEKEKRIALDDCKVQLIKVEADPEQILISAEMIKRIQQAIDALPPRCKMIFKLVREEGLRNKDVAQILGISINTIDVQLAIAIKKISHAINLDTSGRQPAGITLKKTPGK